MWNPIETAPKTGVEIKLFVSNYLHDEPSFQCVAAWSKRYRQWLVLGDYAVEEDGAEATHWAPLDPEPEAA